MRSKGLLPLLLLGACTFAWDELDPRGAATTGGGGEPGRGGGSASSSSVATSTSGVGGTGGTGGSGGAVPPVTVTLGERPSCDITDVTEDANLDQGGPDLNYGASGAIQVDINQGVEVRGLLRFRLTKLPAGAQIVAAELRLTTDDGVNAGSAGTVQFYTLAEDWTEGSSVGDIGTASWNERRVGLAWASPGAGPDSRSLFSIASVVMSTPATEYAVPIPTSLAQTWLDDPDRNFGVVLEVETSDGVTLTSSNSSTQMARPMMVVTFVPP